MPKKKIRKGKTREYLEGLLDRVGVTDRQMALSIKAGLASENSLERTNALTTAARWKGFLDVDKKAGEDIERLNLGNISIEDIDKLCNRCAYCKHVAFVPLHNIKAEDKVVPAAKNPISAIADNPPEPIVKEIISDEPNPQEKVD